MQTASQEGTDTSAMCLLDVAGFACGHITWCSLRPLSHWKVDLLGRTSVQGHQSGFLVGTVVQDFKAQYTYPAQCLPRIKKRLEESAHRATLSRRP